MQPAAKEVPSGCAPAREPLRKRNDLAGELPSPAEPIHSKRSCWKALLGGIQTALLQLWETWQSCKALWFELLSTTSTYILASTSSTSRIDILFASTDFELTASIDAHGRSYGGGSGTPGTPSSGTGAGRGPGCSSNDECYFSSPNLENNISIFFIYIITQCNVNQTKFY
ncbi:hypothetical protein RRG08_028092 [Elysia crispata]|uniref:Uncharacterized protein n=1 Tax=Elysia crispata TaxID=231223 RepID=A0AAE1E742_9GAST|nr:hypothetical protein RRG08_028092 [Elysia crispata]